MNGRGEYQGLDYHLARLAVFFIRHRRWGIVLQVVIAVLCLWAISGLRLRDDPNAWPPRNDPFVLLNQSIMAIFGGGNSVSIEVVADGGSIFTQANLATIKSITDDLYLIHGCIPYTVRSVATLSSERYAFLNKGTPDETMVVTPIMAEPPKTTEDLKQIQAAVNDNPMLNGVLVSKDGKAALILADFRSEVPPHALFKPDTTEPVAIYAAVQAILKKHQRPGITLRAAGTPILIGWVNSVGLRYVLGAFVFFLAIVAVVLWYGFRSYSGVVLPLRVALLGALMGFGLYRVIFGATLLSASAFIAPFIIVAAGACHSVQFLSRFFYEEYPRLKRVEDAIVSTFVSRLRPMLVSLLCDVIPFAVMAVIPFDNVRTLGLVTGLGLLSLTIDEFLLMIPALSFVTSRELEGVEGQLRRRERSKRMDASLARLITRILSDQRTCIVIIVGCVLVSAAGLWVDMRTPVVQNNTYAVHNYLTHSWQRSDIYQMEREITARFGGVYPMTILITAKPGEKKVLEEPAVVEAIDRLAGFLRQQPGLGSVADVAFPVKLGNAFIHGEDSQYFRVPNSHYALGQSLLNIADRAPGAYLWLFTNDLQSCVVIAYAASTNASLVKPLIESTKRRAKEIFAKLPVTVGVAGGSVGIAQAFNDDIAYWLVVGAVLGFAGTAILAVPFIGSVRLALVLMAPLIMGTILAVAIMCLVGIELNSNAIAALAIASGVGIDSEVYLLFRVREEYKRLGDFREALIEGYVKIRSALLVSNGALILGCWALVPVPLYIGYVGFGMGLVLLLCFGMSAVLSPILWLWFGEGVVVGRGNVHSGGENSFSEPAERLSSQGQ